MVSYCNASDVEAELRADNSFSSSTVPTKTEVDSWIEEISDEVRHIAAQEYDSQTVTQTFDYEGDGSILLPNTPVDTLSDVEYTDHAETETKNYESLTEEEDYEFYADQGLIDLYDEHANYKTGKKRFRVSYDYGTGSIPARIRRLVAKKTALRVLTSLLNRDLEDENAGSETRVGSITIKKPANYGTENLRMLKSEINDLEERLRDEFKVFRSEVYS